MVNDAVDDSDVDGDGDGARCWRNKKAEEPVKPPEPREIAITVEKMFMSQPQFRQLQMRT